MGPSFALGEKVSRLPEAARFEHSIFALPFAHLGMVLTARGLADLPQDTLNRRMAGRTLPQRSFHG